MRKPKKDGKEFEEIVCKIQAGLDPQSIVKHNERIINKFGHARQFDVVIRGKCAGIEFLGVMECKDISRKIGVEIVEQFSRKAEDINANLKMLVSKKGFTRNALDMAAKMGIQAYSILPDEESEAGFIVGHKWQAYIYQWTDYVINFLVDDVAAVPSYDLSRVSINGQNIFEWFSTYLNTNHQIERNVGWREWIKEFKVPALVDNGSGEVFYCRGIRLSANRAILRKQKYVGMKGDAFYDWKSGTVKIPQGSKLSTFPILADFHSWDDADDLPDEGTIFRIILHGSTREYFCSVDIFSL